MTRATQLTGLLAGLLLGMLPAAHGAGARVQAVGSRGVAPRLVPRVSSDALQQSGATRTMTPEALRQAAIKAGPLKPKIDQSQRRNFPDPKTLPQVNTPGTMPWHFDITATYFIIGGVPTPEDPNPSTACSWDENWRINYGGFDDPDPAKRCPINFVPTGFVPQMNPYYVALPYNDIQKDGPKPEAPKVIPWYHRDKGGKYESVCRGTWVQIYYNGRYCFAQWHDCGPFVTDDWEYVFGGARPKNKNNQCAGIDLSPAVRDYLGIPGGMAKVHWRFVDFSRVPGGPWAKYGKDNPFVNPEHKQHIRRFKNLHRISTRESGADKVLKARGRSRTTSSK